MNHLKNKIKDLPEDLQKALIALVAIPFMMFLAGVSHTGFEMLGGNTGISLGTTLTVTLSVLTVGGLTIMSSVGVGIVGLTYMFVLHAIT